MNLTRFFFEFKVYLASSLLKSGFPAFTQAVRQKLTVTVIAFSFVFPPFRSIPNEIYQHIHQNITFLHIYFFTITPSETVTHFLFSAIAILIFLSAANKGSTKLCVSNIKFHIVQKKKATQKQIKQ